MTILVTGGAGYIGSQTVLALLEKQHTVVILDNLSKGHAEVVPSEVTLEIADLNDIDSIRGVFKKYTFDGVIHFAGSIEVAESQVDPSKYYQNNTTASLNLVEVMREFGVKNIVFSSTAATYGLPKSVPILETSELAPINTYGRSKLMTEHVLRDYTRSYDFNTICLRYFNACGADSLGRCGEMHEPETHLIPNILKSVIENTSVTVFGTDYTTADGTCVRDYIHTMDLADAHVLAIEKIIQNTGESIAESINLGTKTGYSINQIIETVEQVTGKMVNKVYGERRAGDPDMLVADNTKAFELLGWSPKYSDLKNIIQTAWNWHTSQKV
jgi:UDP-glucose 4-epimerase